MICLPALRPLRPITIRPALIALLAFLPACCLARPIVAITTPRDGDTLAAPTAVRVQFRTDSRRPVARVELYADGREAAFANVQPPLLEGYRNLTLDPAGLLPGPHRLTARALDSAGEAGSAEISIQTVALAPAGPDTQRPSVSIYSPAQGAVVSGKIQVRAEAFDNAGVRSALFYVDGKLHTLRMGAVPLSADWDTRAVADGPHTLSVRASDQADNWGQSSDVTVVVRNQSTPPVNPITPVAPGPAPVTGGQPAAPSSPSLPAVGPLTNPPLGTGPLVPDVPVVVVPEPVRPPVTSAADPGNREPVIVTPPGGLGTHLVSGPPAFLPDGAPGDIEPPIVPSAPTLPPPAETAAWIPGEAGASEPAPEPEPGGLLAVEPAAVDPLLPADEPAAAIPDGVLPVAAPEPAAPEPAAPEPAAAAATIPDPELSPVATDPADLLPGLLSGSDVLLATTPEIEPGVPAPEPSLQIAPPPIETLPEPPVVPEPADAVPVEVDPVVDATPAPATEPGLLEPVAATPAPLEPGPELGLAPAPPGLEPVAPPSGDATVAEPEVPTGPVGTTPIASTDVVAPPVELYHEGPVAAVPGATLEGPAGPRPGDNVAPPPVAEGYPTVTDAPRLRGARIDWDGKPGAGALRPELVDGVLMVSLKHYFDAADGAVYWFPEDKLARAVSADADLTIRIGKDRAMLNGTPHDLGRPPVVRDGRVMVPLDIVAQALGLALRYDADANLLHVTRRAQ